MLRWGVFIYPEYQPSYLFVNLVQICRLLLLPMKAEVEKAEVFAIVFRIGNIRTTIWLPPVTDSIFSCKIPSICVIVVWVLSGRYMFNYILNLPFRSSILFIHKLYYVYKFSINSETIGAIPMILLGNLQIGLSWVL